MSLRVLRVHSTITLPLEELHTVLSDLTLPESLRDVEFERRKKTLELTAVPREETAKYTPAASLVGKVTERRVPDPDAPEPEEEEETPGWSDEETPMMTIEIAAFKGRDDDLLRSTAFREEMFLVLADIARSAEGELTAILLDDGELRAVRIVDGEDRDATVEVVETEETGGADNAVDWRSNDLIK